MKIRLGLLIVLVIFLSACSIDNYLFSYIFKNETQYTIYVTVGDNYEIKENGGKNAFNKSTPIVLDGIESPATSNEVLIQAKGASVLDFKWTAENEMDNIKIQSKVTGTSVTFREI